MPISVICGDSLAVLSAYPDATFQCCVTSPPYFGQRDYGSIGQIGTEETIEAYIANLVSVFREVRRVLKPNGILWLNIGDCYCGSNKGGVRDAITASVAISKAKVEGRTASQRRPSIYRRAVIPAGMKAKDLMGLPWMVAAALRSDGWHLRSSVIWNKPNPIPEPVKDRPSASYEHVFLLTKGASYFFDSASIAEPTRNAQDVWVIPTSSPFESGPHPAIFPPALAEKCILSGSREGDVVLDPFGGFGTTGLVADRLKRDAVLIEINPKYAASAHDRILNDAPLFVEVCNNAA